MSSLVHNGMIICVNVQVGNFLSLSWFMIWFQMFPFKLTWAWVSAENLLLNEYPHRY